MQRLYQCLFRWLSDRTDALCGQPTLGVYSPRQQAEQQLQPWTRFKYDRREFEWSVTKVISRRLHVRSVNGDFYVHCMIQDYEPYAFDGDPIAFVSAPTIVGTEYPLGETLTNVKLPYSLDGIWEVARYGVIHTELVRSLLGRWCHRRRYRRLLKASQRSSSHSRLGGRPG